MSISKADFLGREGWGTKDGGVFTNIVLLVLNYHALLEAPV